MTLTEKLLEITSSLSDEQLSEVIDFAEYLKFKEEKQQATQKSEADPLGDLWFYL